MDNENSKNSQGDDATKNNSSRFIEDSFMPVLPLRSIESGGQTGADHAALDVARKFNFPHGGWCPKGRKAEDGPISEDYKLRETPSTNYLQRTEWNAQECCGTVIFTNSPNLSGGSKRTAAFANKHHRPYLHLHLGSAEPEHALREFIRKHCINRLNVAGSRSSRAPELYDWVRRVMEDALFKGAPACYVGNALSHLGPNQLIVQVTDNADGPPCYNVPVHLPAWRFYYDEIGERVLCVGGSSPFILIEKGTGRIVGGGAELGE